MKSTPMRFLVLKSMEWFKHTDGYAYTRLVTFETLSYIGETSSRVMGDVLRSLLRRMKDECDAGQRRLNVDVVQKRNDPWSEKRLMRLGLGEKLQEPVVVSTIVLRFLDPVRTMEVLKVFDSVLDERGLAEMQKICGMEVSEEAKKVEAEMMASSIPPLFDPRELVT